MAENGPKLPKSGGAQKALETIKKFRSQQPSERLVKIISDYGHEKCAGERIGNSAKKRP